MTYYLLVIFSVFAAACAQMLLKKGASLPSPSGEGLGVRLIRQYLNPWVIGGYGIMFVALAVNIFAMSKGVQVKEVSTMESLSYLFVPCLSWIIFNEQMNWKKIISIAIIIIGILIFFV